MVISLFTRLILNCSNWRQGLGTLTIIRVCWSCNIIWYGDLDFLQTHRGRACVWYCAIKRWSRSGSMLAYWLQQWEGTWGLYRSNNLNTSLVANGEGKIQLGRTPLGHVSMVVWLTKMLLVYGWHGSWLFINLKHDNYLTFVDDVVGKQGCHKKGHTTVTKDIEQLWTKPKMMQWLVWMTSVPPYRK